MELWKDVPGYEGLYQISNFGNVKSLERIDNSNHFHEEKILKQKIFRNGYWYVNLSKDGKHHNYHVHRIVAKLFVKNSLNKPQVNHIDGDKTNNNVNNLEWVTMSENIRHGYKTGLISTKGEKNGQHKLKRDDVNRIRNIKNNHPKITHQRLADIFNVSCSNITMILNNKAWRCII